jgi:hypothetical protein
MTLARDTAAAARDIQVEALRRLDGSTRVRMAVDMSEEARHVTLAGIRHRHPDWTDTAVHQELLRLLLGRELTSAVLERLSTRP